MGEKILEVNHLKTYFHTDAGLSKAVNDVSFFVEKGKTLGIVGESGCGKSITSLSIMGLVETPPGEIAGGEIIFEGEDLLKKDLPADCRGAASDCLPEAEGTGGDGRREAAVLCDRHGGDAGDRTGTTD